MTGKGAGAWSWTGRLWESGWMRVRFLGSQKGPFFPELEQTDGGKEGPPPALIICHLPFLQGLPVLRRRRTV